MAMLNNQRVNLLNWFQQFKLKQFKQAVWSVIRGHPMWDHMKQFFFPSDGEYQVVFEVLKN